MPTINDVARAAGVSPSTVSYVLSGRRPISAADPGPGAGRDRRAGLPPARRRPGAGQQQDQRAGPGGAAAGGRQRAGHHAVRDRAW